MRAVIQRVARCRVTVEGKEISRIGAGIMILFCVEKDDDETLIDRFAQKCSKLRIFDDDQGVMNRNVVEAGGDVMVISQFTLSGNISRGNRPSYIRAAGHDKAIPFYERFCHMLGEYCGREVAKGIFGADMQVELVNSGPVTIMYDSETN